MKIPDQRSGFFTAPQPRSAWGIVNTVSELLGGFDHFKNYLSFITHGGMDRVIEKCGMEVKEEIIDKTGAYKVVKAT